MFSQSSGSRYFFVSAGPHIVLAVFPFFFCLELGVQVEGSQEGTGNERVFVAGASGNTGRRIVKELLSQGYKVRAGVRDIGAASNILPSNPNVDLVSCVSSS